MKIKKGLVKIALAVAMVPALSLSSCKFFEDAAQWIKDTAGQIRDWGEGVVNYFASGDFSSDFLSFTSSAYEEVKNWVINAGEQIGDWFTATKDGIVAFFTNVQNRKFELDRRSSTLYGIEDYVGDPETISIGLLNRYLSLNYSTFYGTVIYQDNEYEGICFSAIEDTAIVHFSEETSSIVRYTGFISIDPENPLPAEARENYLFIEPITQTSDDSINYLLALDIDPFLTHVVSNGKYIQYGVDNNQTLIFTSTNYTGTYDKKLGGLYSFDSEKYLYGTTNDYVVTKDFYSTVKSSEVSTGFWDIVKRGFGVAVSTLIQYVKNAKNYLIAFFDELTSGTFLGYNVSQLKSKINSTSEKVIVETKDNVTTITPVDSQNPPVNNVTNMAKWLLGLSTLVIFVINIIVQMVAMFLPPPLNIMVKALMGAITASSLHLFFNYTLAGKSLKNIDWKKIIIVSFAGAIGSFTKVVGDAIIGGLTDAAFSLIDGDTFSHGIVSFIEGFTISIAIAAIAKLFATAISKLVSKISYKIRTNKIKSLLLEEYGADNLSEEDAKEIAAAKIASDCIDDQITSSSSANNELTKALAGQLPSDSNQNIGIFDEFGNRVSKVVVMDNLNGKYYIKMLDSASSSFVERWLKLLGPNGMLRIINGEISFEDISVATIRLSSDNLSTNRDYNFRVFRNQLAELWSQDPSQIPPEYYNYFVENGIDVEFLEAKDIQNLQQHFGLTIHECADRITMCLVDSVLHSALSHGGGVFVTKFLIAKSEYLFLMILKGAF